MIKLEKVNKYFNRRKRNEIHIINDTSLQMDKTGLVAILGQSGSGKTTLLNVIGGLDKVSKGKIYINGKKITRKRAHTVDKIRNLNIGYIFQDYKLLENLSVYENVAMSLRMVGIKNKKEIEKRVRYVLDSVNMDRYRNRPAKMLSGGEKQRVAIARALVKNPNIVIADEPTGNLDSKNSLEIMNIIKAISKDKLVILVTHEVDLANFYASRIIELKDGKIVSDKENEASEVLDYRLENKIYLKDFKKIEKLNKDNINIDVYSNEDEKIDVKLVIKNGNIYIQSESNKVEVVNEDSAIELIDGHYKKIDKSIYQEYKYNLDEVIDKKYKYRYSSIFGIFRSIANGFRKIANYSAIKKILLLGFVASSMFVVYAVTNIFGTLNIKETDYITRDKNYLQVEMSRVNVDDFLKYEKLENIDYMIPGNSMISFQVGLKDYYQISRYSLGLYGSLVSLDKVTKEDIILGRAPENEYEIVADKLILDSMKKNNQMAKALGIDEMDDLLNKKATIKNLKEFTIVGFVDKGSPSIYANKSMFINMLANSDTQDIIFGFYINGVDSENQEEKILDCNLFLDDITLKKGKMPTEDYEVIVNIQHENDMKLNKTIKVKVNEKELKVVGYYESKENNDYYLVNNNTIKYDLIYKRDGCAIYPKDKEAVLQEFKEDYKLNILDVFEKDKKKYMSEQEETIRSAIIFAGIILGISLIEIYLMIRSSFLSRIKEIGVLRAIGVKKADIYRMFLGEILAITTCSSLPGIILMTYIMQGIKQIPFIGNEFVVNFVTIGLSTIIVYAFNIIVGLMPLFRVLRKTPAGILARHDLE